ncbi:amidase domain-containing protein [Clostridium gasigenes]|uniref:amidase domain-containing protein n=1 Tax=Clostridium gasigenes TaxID=94869 RepID=UPI003397A4DE
MKNNIKKFIVFMIIILILDPLGNTLVFADEPFALPEESASTVNDTSPTSDALKSEFDCLIKDLFIKRNISIVSGDCEELKDFYDLNVKVSQYAYESEVKKAQYLMNWSGKQSVVFKNLDSIVKVRKVKEKEPGLFGVICDVITEFNYYYTDSPQVINTFRLGTNHYLNLKKTEDRYIITKEWYTDPFADSLNLNNIKTEEVKKYILSKEAPAYTSSEKVQKAIDYAHTYCGASTDENFIFKYNSSKYKNHNPDGGDCANFASQILHEGGGLKKNVTWNYAGKNGTKAWLNAQGFKGYMLGSGRGSSIAKGSYQQVYKAAYNMRPGDFVAYERKGRIVHISTVTGLDSKGYPLVTCHNTDRLLVPYDLGWSNENITFHLVHTHY